ncbi:hypothetical protein [Rhizobium leguminosarum]|nr:hypothetical protein [Rhizobium leguminosarum]
MPPGANISPPAARSSRSWPCEDTKIKRRQRAVGDCAEDAAFSPSQADGAGVSADDGKERLGEMVMLAGFDVYFGFPRATAQLLPKTG